MWWRRSSGEGTLAFEFDAELSARLRRAAEARGEPPEVVVAELIARGLDLEGRRRQVEAALAALTPREREIATLAARGYTNRQIAEALIISPETVKTHMRHVLEKFGVRSKADLRLLLLEVGLWEEGA